MKNMSSYRSLINVDFCLDSYRGPVRGVVRRKVSWSYLYFRKIAIVVREKFGEGLRTSKEISKENVIQQERSR